MAISYSIGLKGCGGGVTATACTCLSFSDTAMPPKRATRSKAQKSASKPAGKLKATAGKKR